MQPTQEEQDEAMYEKQIQDYQECAEEQAYHTWLAENLDTVKEQFLQVAKDDFDKYCREFYKYCPKEM